jgi:enolase
MNLINGGLHARSRLAFQEYLLVPQTESVEEALRIGVLVMHEAGRLISEKYGPSSANLGDEGGFAPDIADVKEPLRMLLSAAENLGLTDKIKLSLDAAANSFFRDGEYDVGGKKMGAEELLGLYREICSEFPMLSIEDPFSEESFDEFARLNDGAVMVVGDDLTVTNSARLSEAARRKSISGVIIKPNQVGTLTETIGTMKTARAAGVECVVSHRSGETKDDFISDLAYAYGVFALKAGAPQREERIAKYNRLLEIVGRG